MKDVLCKIRTYYPKTIVLLISHKKSAADLADKVVEIGRAS